MLLPWCLEEGEQGEPCECCAGHQEERGVTPHTEDSDSGDLCHPQESLYTHSEGQVPSLPVQEETLYHVLTVLA